MGARPPPPDFVVGAPPEQAVGGRRTHCGGVTAREDQRIGAQCGGSDAGELHRPTVTVSRVRKGGRGIDEVGTPNVQVAQLVERVFVEVGEQRGAVPGEAGV